MTLMELLVALAILSVSVSALFAALSPAVLQSRLMRSEAAVWSAAPTLQLTLAELAAGYTPIDDPVIGETSASFTTLTPRIAPHAFRAALAIEPMSGGQRLVLVRGGVRSLLLETEGELRFRRIGRAPARGFVVEQRTRGAWRTLASAAFAADAPLTCVFDVVAQTCQ